MIRRIALVTHDLAGSGGVATVTRFLHQILTASGRYQPEIISLATSARDTCSVRLLSPASWLHGPQIRQQGSPGLTYRHVGAWLAEVELLRYRPRSLLTKQLDGFDLVQIVAGTPAWAHVAAGLKKPVALHVATLVAVERATRLGSGSGFRQWWFRWMTQMNARLEARTLPRLDCTLVMNQWMFEHVSRMMGHDRVLMAVPGVDTDFFQPGDALDPGYIIAVGRFLDPRKNIRLLLNAYARVLRRSRAIPDLVLVGSAPSAENQQYLSELGVADRVRIHQNVSREQLGALYRGASLLALSSDEEGLGMVILEAMASGLPVVSTDCGGPSTTVVEGKTGFLTPVGDAGALANAIQQLLEDPSLRRRMGQAGRQRAEERFSLPAAGRVILDKYDQLLQ